MVRSRQSGRNSAMDDVDLIAKLRQGQRDLLFARLSDDNHMRLIFIIDDVIARLQMMPVDRSEAAILEDEEIDYDVMAARP